MVATAAPARVERIGMFFAASRTVPHGWTRGLEVTGDAARRGSGAAAAKSASLSLKTHCFSIWDIALARLRLRGACWANRSLVAYLLVSEPNRFF